MPSLPRALILASALVALTASCGPPRPDRDGEDPCSEGERRCRDGATAQLCDALGRWESLPCATGTGCDQGLCLEQVCQAGATRCAGDGLSLETCSPGGTAWVAEACAQPGACQQGACVAFACTPGGSRCVDAKSEERCAGDGSGWIAVACQGSEQCLGDRCAVPVCTPGQTRCSGSTHQERCLDDASGWQAELCQTPGACLSGACRVFQCEPGAWRCTSINGFERCAADGSGWISGSCPVTQVCYPGGRCDAPACVPSETLCTSPTTYEQCREDATGWEGASCGPQQACVEGACLDTVCTPGVVRCPSLSSSETCDAQGVRWVTAGCGGNQSCVEAVGCVDRVCTPGAAGCADELTPGTCSADGTRWVPGAACTGGKVCDAGQCVADPCLAAVTGGWPSGCEFRTAPTGGLDTQEISFLAVNPGSVGATLTVRDAAGAQTQHAVPARGGVVVSKATKGLGEETLKVSDQYRLSADRPLFLSQLTPSTRPDPLPCDLTCQFSGGTCSATNTCEICEAGGACAEVLNVAGRGAGAWIPPAHLLETRYIVPALPLLSYFDSADSRTSVRSWRVSVQATGAGATSVTVKAAGAILAGGGVPALRAGQTHTLTLNQGETLHLVAENVSSTGDACAVVGTVTQCDRFASNLAGTEISASQPVAVVTGASCFNVPKGASGCDELEAYVPPATRGGRAFVVAPADLSDPAPQVILVQALDSAATVTLVGGGATRTVSLPAKGWNRWTVTGAHTLEASAPVLVARLTVGREAHAKAFDPGLEILAPRGAWRQASLLHLPVTLVGASLVLVGDAGTTVAVGGQSYTLTPIPNTQRGWALHKVSAAGTLAVSASAPVGLSLLAGDRKPFLGSELSWGAAMRAGSGW